jgi:hypothetical protein
VRTMEGQWCSGVKAPFIPTTVGRESGRPHAPAVVSPGKEPLARIG